MADDLRLFVDAEHEATLSNDKACKNCAFFFRGPNGEEMTCRRHSPGQGDSWFPETLEENWCGDFQLRLNPDRTKHG